MFYIGFVSHPRRDGDGRRRARGEITLGDDSPAFDADLEHWSPSTYLSQWRQGIARLAAGATSSALVTSYAGPGAASHEMWPMWREGAVVTLRRQSVDGDALGSHDDAAANDFYELAATLRNDEADGTARVWRMPLGQLLAFTIEDE